LENEALAHRRNRGLNRKLVFFRSGGGNHWAKLVIWSYIISIRRKQIMQQKWSKKDLQNLRKPLRIWLHLTRRRMKNLIQNSLDSASLSMTKSRLIVLFKKVIQLRERHCRNSSLQLMDFINVLFFIMQRF
jgi:hypothetical protein